MPIEEEIRRAEKLKEIRKNLPKGPLKTAKSVASVLSLGAYINPFLDWLFGIALSLALLKDILDLVGIGSFPAIGTVITFMVSFTIGVIMFLTGSGSKTRIVRSLVKRYGTLIGGTIVEFIFGIDFLPVETAIVIIVFFITLKERQKATQNSSLQENYA